MLLGSNRDEGSLFREQTDYLAGKRCESAAGTTHTHS